MNLNFSIMIGENMADYHIKLIITNEENKKSTAYETTLG